MLSDEEFKHQFYAASNDMQKIKLAIREKRYSIWNRADRPNLRGSEYLAPVLDLPDSHPVEKRMRQSGGQGGPQVLITKYMFRGMGRSIEIYLKGFFGTDGGLSIRFSIQSLRDDAEETQEGGHHG